MPPLRRPATAARSFAPWPGAPPAPAQPLGSPRQVHAADVRWNGWMNEELRRELLARAAE